MSFNVNCVSHSTGAQWRSLTFLTWSTAVTGQLHLLVHFWSLSLMLNIRMVEGAHRQRLAGDCGCSWVLTWSFFAFPSVSSVLRRKCGLEVPKGLSLCFQTQLPTSVHPGRVGDSWVLGLSHPPSWEMCVACRAPGFGLAQAQLLQASRELISGWKYACSLFCLSTLK